MAGLVVDRDEVIGPSNGNRSESMARCVANSDIDGPPTSLKLRPSGVLDSVLDSRLDGIRI
jgi:hypothetical protein